MRAAVTGGAGFIGSHVVDALVARGDEVHVIDNFATGRRENLNEAATLHELDIREPLAGLFEEIQPELVVHLAAQADVGTSVERPLFDAEVNVRRNGERARGGAPARRAARLQLHRRRDLRRVRAPGAGGRRAAAALALRHRQARGRGVPRDLEPAARDAARRAPVRERLRAAPAGEARGRRRRDLHRPAPRRRERDDLRRRRADARLRLRRRRRRGRARRGRPRRRRLQRRHRDGDVGERALRRHAGAWPASRPRRRMRPPGQATSSAASSTSPAPSASSAGGRRRRSRRGCA